MNRTTYSYDSPPLMFDGELEVVGTPEYWRQLGYHVFDNYPSYGLFTVETDDA